MSNLNKHSIGFTDLDWITIQELADKEGKTPSQWINRVCGEYAAQQGKQWRGTQPRGDVSRFKVNGK